MSENPDNLNGSQNETVGFISVGFEINGTLMGVLINGVCVCVGSV